MVDKIDPIPDEMTIAEASEFWDTHSLADYPSEVVQIEYVPDETITLVPIASQLVSRLQKRAHKNGISLETLINLWLQEKLVVA